ncbi:MAG: DUF349 domain-containing protein [Cyclobacteriaceae bacterium]|nr:DUF349 domain-containing protein [Cyclobacteriaceae bacterium]
MMENEKEVQEEVQVEDSLVTPTTHHDEEHDVESEEHHEVDYGGFTKAELVSAVKDLAKEDNFKKVDQALKEIKPLYEEIRATERREALEKFMTDGGIEEDFEYRLDELDHTFDATVKLIRDRRNEYFKNLENRKNENLRKKNEILENLRTLIDGEDSAHSFNTFKELQQAWKQVGPIPPAQVKTLWANYNALVDRFYDHRNIYFELKELDRKKNLEAKLELCTRAEQLTTRERIKDAVKELNELHNEFKHVGPVPKEDQETVWQRFKAASDAVYAKRDELVASMQAELKANFEAKSKIADEVQTFLHFTTDRIKDWNKKTQEILELQKRWDAVGGTPRTKSKELNKKFWSAFKQFFHNKNQFFKKLDEERDKNLKAKQQLVARAIELKASNDWNKTSQELKQLQLQWKEIGPVPEKQRDKIYKEFKEACDFFFDQRRGSQVKADQEQEVNLKQKEAIIDEMIAATIAGNTTVEQLTEIQSRFNDIGFVPKNAIASVKQRFADAVAKYVQSIAGLSEAEREQTILQSQLSGLKNDPQAERKLYLKEQTLRKQIQKAENDLSTLRNNLEFFGRSKNAEKLKGEFNDKIEEANQHLAQLKKQLKMLKSV